MDLALLIATALGAIALYLMMPREKATLVKLGAMLGMFALGGVFLYMIRLNNRADHGLAGPDVLFYVFSGIMVAGAVGVICHPKPVYAALYFVLITLAGAGLFVMLLAEFMAVVLIIVYAGAILVTYVFVLMLASQSHVGSEAPAPLYDRRSSEPFAAVLVSFVLLGAVLQMIFSPNFHGVNPIQSAPLVAAAATQPALATVPATQPAAAPVVASTPLQALGFDLYNRYALSLELAGVLLTIALVGAVVIARKGEVLAPVAGTGEVPAE